jgi:hypothetical protein
VGKNCVENICEKQRSFVARASPPFFLKWFNKEEYVRSGHGRTVEKHPLASLSSFFTSTLAVSTKRSFAVHRGLLYSLLEMNTWTKDVFAVFLVFPVFKTSPRSCYERDSCRKLTRKRVIDVRASAGSALAKTL